MPDTPEITDSHCHLDFPDFADELPDVIDRALAAGVTRMVTICTRLRLRTAGSRHCRDLCPGVLRRRHSPDECR